ncbi:oxidoreductase [Ktedonosporobacter rubrisoli]|nr:oxidoreductase [Ktedonosporobacter rubrisoli]
MSENRASRSAGRVWFITGTSTGLGRALAEAVVAHGERLVATARRPECLQDLADSAPDRVLALPLDVTSPEQVRTAVEEAIEHFGQIDVLVNNAGYGLFGALEEVSDIEAYHQFETNVFGTLRLTRAVLPFMRAQRSGHILMMSSTGGLIAPPGSSMYNGSKFAIEGIAEALSQEVVSFGIHVTLVEPGVFRTDVLGRSLKRTQLALDDYAPMNGFVRQWVEQNNGTQQGDPAKAAQAMIKVVEAPEPPLRLALGADALELIHKKLAWVASDLQTWEATALSTAFTPDTDESNT